MTNYVYPLATATWDQAEYDAIQHVIRSGMFTMGPQVQAFEAAFANYVGSQYAVMVNSGSSANLLMVAALFFVKENALKAGDEVIVPAVSWSTTYYPLHQYGLKIRFVDVDLNTLNYDLEQLSLAITDRTRLIVAVNLLGNPNDFRAIADIVADRNILLIEDNCESMGAEFDGKKAGTFGVVGSFSSFFSHHISTMEGGIVVTDDEEIYHILLSMRAHGWTRNLPKNNRVTGVKDDDPFKESFNFVLPGYNVRPLEMSGAIGIEQVKKLPSLVAERRKNAALFQGALSNHKDLIIQKEIGKSSWFGFSLIVRPESSLTRAELLSALNKLGFECRPIVAGNFAKNPVVKYFDYTIHGDLRNANRVDSHGLFIGNHHYSISEAIEVLSNLNF